MINKGIYIAGGQFNAENIAVGDNARVIVREENTKPLIETPSLLKSRDKTEPKESYDVFISYASEDRDSFVSPFVSALEAQQLKVWYDMNQISIGDKLNEALSEAMRDCRFGNTTGGCEA